MAAVPKSQEGLEGFLAEVGDDLERGVLSPRIYNDPDIHERELEKIFSTCWVFVGHESEIPDAGDYVLRYIGRDQFILARAEDGEINLLYNACMHRATSVCHADKGNASHFRCPYHGWIYKNNGDWNGAPQRIRAYGNSLDPKEWGLRKAPRLESYRGLIFANLDENAVTLDEYLGEMKWYLDITFGLTEEGMRVVGDPHRWEIPANWKMAADNFSGDGYHVPNLHRSGEEIGIMPHIDNAVDIQWHVSLPGGHGLIANKGFLPNPPFTHGGFLPDIAAEFDLDKLSPDQRQFIENGWGPTVFTIFPNFSVIRAPGVFDPVGGTPPVMFTALRSWRPLAADQTEIWNWPMAINGIPEWYNKLAYDTSVAHFGPGGMFEQDDTVAWSGGVGVGRSSFARKHMKLNFQLGEGGKDGYGVQEDWPYPGVASTNAFDEMNQRRFYQRWQKEMTK